MGYKQKVRAIQFVKDESTVERFGAGVKQQQTATPKLAQYSRPPFILYFIITSLVISKFGKILSNQNVNPYVWR
jgi:hypothetical protein